ncbi:MAG: lytic transglycosylase domain-containing protein [Rhodospirillales bacterium]|nr:lytic transglycosylase domain-containing protein [Rhodospirillales bacterium]
MTTPPHACPRPGRLAELLRLGVALAALAALAGCAGTRQQAQVNAPQEAAQYVAHARRDYRVPGPPGDPWGPYITEAAQKYDVPERWIRAVMRQESGGQLYLDGRLITSSAGAMGLMQVMPETYDELHYRYGLGTDPFDPHDNIMAGAAYMRELYDIYGSPGFLAAYNAGPRRLDDYLTRHKALPDETRHYVASVGPAVITTAPLRPSQATQYAMLQLPINIPPGPRVPPRRQQAPVALAANTANRTGWGREEVQMAALPAPPSPPPLPSAPHATGGFHLIPHAYADTLPMRSVGPASGAWAIQVGAFGSESQARAAAEAAKGRARTLLAGAQLHIGTVHQAHGTLYRARLRGLSRETATQACVKLGHCMVVSPDAQS